jgi:hypothetical protein
VRIRDRSFTSPTRCGAFGAESNEVDAAARPRGPAPTQSLSQTTVCDRIALRPRRDTVPAGRGLTKLVTKSTQRNGPAGPGFDTVPVVAHKIAYARVSTADQNPDLQLDALAVEGYLKIYTDVATGTKADRPQWNECLKDLRPGDTLIIWKIDRLGRNLRDLIDIVTTLDQSGVAVKSLTNGIVDTTTAHASWSSGCSP